MDQATAGTAHRSATRTLGRFRNIPAAVREELAQDATLRTLMADHVLEPSRYASRVATRLGIDWLRRRIEHPFAEPADLQEAVPFERRVEASIELRRVQALIEAAPATHRETLQVLFVEDASLAEVVAVGADDERGLERDRWYKRRRRALTWIRAAA